MRTFHAPGRANLIGEHTDHTDGLVLPVALDRGLTLRVEPGGDRIVIRSDGADEVADVPADGHEAPADGFGRFVAAVAAELDELGRPPVGCTGELRSDLPQGAGLSSSAALEVVVALALQAIAGDDAPTLSPIEVAALGRRAEHRAVGVPSGIMDQAASVLGRRDHAVLLDCGTLEVRHVPMPAGLRLLVLDTGVRRQLEHSGYAQRTEELRAALPVLGGRRPVQVAVAELDDLLAGLDAVPARRLRHVVTENERVRATADALTQGDLPAVGRLFAAGHASLRDDFEVSIAELDGFVEVALDAGAVAARMTGGGFGGAAIALVEVDRVDDVAADAEVAYRRRFPDRTPAVHRCAVADGAGERTGPS
ncbi:MAG: galactokinase [Nitriliruptoraceae bacterium]|nr:galactokinase [Nitriliruptoraceae bacterium]